MLVRAIPCIGLASGTFLALLGQYISEMGAYHPSAQLIPACKYVGIIFASTGFERTHKTSKHRKFPQELRISTMLGVLDLTAYLFACLGFAYCGVAAAAPVFGACGQIFNAALHRWFQRKRLSCFQYVSLFLVTLGLLIRPLPPTVLSHVLLIMRNTVSHFMRSMTDISIHNVSSYVMNALEGPKVFGILCIVTSAALYSTLGALYEVRGRGLGSVIFPTREFVCLLFPVVQ